MRLLSLLENLPPKRLIVFTTTEENPFDEILFSRLTWIEFGEPPIPEVVKLLREIASAEGFNLANANLTAFVDKRNCNVRRCLRDLEKGLGKTIQAAKNRKEVA